MSTAIIAGRRADLAGSLWMITAMAAFAIEDVFVKAASATLPVGQILVLFGLGGALVFTGLARYHGEPVFIPDVLSRPMLVRLAFEITGRLFYVLAIALIPLSAATVILQATPLVVVAGAVLVFGEQVGWRRWVAILVGMTGVVIVVQPGASTFSAMSLLAVIGMIGFAGRDLASRVAPATISTVLLGVYGFVAVIVAGTLFALWQGASFVMPGPTLSLYLIGAVLAGVSAYACLMKAMRTGDVSAVTPFRYSRLLFGVAFGVVLFDEPISESLLIGSGLIVLSGLFTLWRGRPR